jgi:hypothetical protein
MASSSTPNKRPGTDKSADAGTRPRTPAGGGAPTRVTNPSANKGG